MKKILISCLLLLFVPNLMVAAPARRGAPAAGAATAGGVRGGARGGASTAAPATSAAPAAPKSNSARAASVGRVVKPGTTAAAKPTGAAPAAPKSNSARAAAMGGVIASGAPKVQSAASNAGVVSEQCKEKFFGCMDSFCMQDNANGARCICSDQVKSYDNILEQIERLDAQSLKLGTDGVAHIDMGEAAEEVDRMVQAAASAISGQDNLVDTNVPQTTTNTRKRVHRTFNISDFDSIGLGIDAQPDLEVVNDPLAGLTGDAFQAGVRGICLKQVQAGCEKDMQMLQMMYSTQIRGDCSGYELELKNRLKASTQKLSMAQTAIKEAALEKFDEQNKFSLGQCMVEMRKCIATTGGCGEDFSKCTFYNTGEGLGASGANMALIPVPGAQHIQVATGTLTSIQSKRQICEATVVKNCVAVKDKVWDAFLADIAPTLKAAELIAEDNQRQNTLSDISDCFLNACKEHMDPKNKEGSYDMCLGNPGIVAKQCKVVLDRAGIALTCTNSGQTGAVLCSVTDPTNVGASSVWNGVVAKLGAMRVDACTTQVKSCLTNENRCGENYQNCVGPRGMDLEMVKRMCPPAALTACAENGVMPTNFDEKLGELALGLFLQIDNAAMDACSAAIDEEVMKFCGSLTDCEMKWGASKIGEVLQLDAAAEDKVVITGLVDFSKFEYCNPSLVDTCSGYVSPGGAKYPTVSINMNVNDANPYNGNSANLSLNNMKKIKQDVEVVTNQLIQNQKIKTCIEGRDISQIDGTDEKTTEGRFPRMLDQYLDMIMMSGMIKADENYRRQYEMLKKNAESSILGKIQDSMFISGGVCWIK